MVAVFISGFFAGYIYSDHMQSRVAVVDIAQVVANSAQVQSLKAEQDMHNAELNQWVQEVQKKINAEGDQAKKEKLVKQYSAELEAKKNTYGQRYVTALQSIDQNLNDTIVSEAKKKGYKFIIAKGMIIGGGDDITADVVKNIK